jgi:hypothetical protein
MKTKDFDIVVNHRLDACKRILIEKAKEYAKGDDDRLHNFNKAARITGKTREECLWGFALKHLVSVTDIIDEMSKDPKYIPSRDLVIEKFGDLHNYLLLLEACIEDKRHNQPLPF